MFHASDGTFVRQDLCGHKFNQLLVLRYVENRRYLCLCDCGKEKIVFSGSLRSGDVKSCGCLNDRVRKEKFTTHGMTMTPEWITWRAMLQRCQDKNIGHYRLYGGRGITVCERWLDFSNFLADIGHRPKNATLESQGTVVGQQEKSRLEIAVQTSSFLSTENLSALLNGLNV